MIVLWLMGLVAVLIFGKLTFGIVRFLLRLLVSPVVVGIVIAVGLWAGYWWVWWIIGFVVSQLLVNHFGFVPVFCWLGFGLSLVGVVFFGWLLAGSVGFVVGGVLMLSMVVLVVVDAVDKDSGRPEWSQAAA